mmetsp:Transcript_765/g.3150  ORF Transcript_765/g.3150 Transcript_765/m.3150 type:complete len:235 (+) Transcript_765:61-765(+)
MPARLPRCRRAVSLRSADARDAEAIADRIAAIDPPERPPFERPWSSTASPSRLRHARATPWFKRKPNASFAASYPSRYADGVRVCPRRAPPTIQAANAPFSFSSFVFSFVVSFAVDRSTATADDERASAPRFRAGVSPAHVGRVVASSTLASRRIPSAFKSFPRLPPRARFRSFSRKPFSVPSFESPSRKRTKSRFAAATRAARIAGGSRGPPGTDSSPPHAAPAPTPSASRWY